MTENTYEIIEPRNIKWLFNDMLENASAIEHLTEFERELTEDEVKLIKEAFNKTRKSLDVLENKVFGNLHASNSETFESYTEREI